MNQEKERCPLPEIYKKINVILINAGHTLFWRDQNNKMHPSLLIMHLLELAIQDEENVLIIIPFTKNEQKEVYTPYLQKYYAYCEDIEYLPDDKAKKEYVREIKKRYNLQTKEIMFVGDNYRSVMEMGTEGCFTFHVSEIIDRGYRYFEQNRQVLKKIKEKLESKLDFNLEKTMKIPAFSKLDVDVDNTLVWMDIHDEEGKRLVGIDDQDDWFAESIRNDVYRFAVPIRPMEVFLKMNKTKKVDAITEVQHSIETNLKRRHLPRLFPYTFFDNIATEQINSVASRRQKIIMAEELAKLEGYKLPELYFIDDSIDEILAFKKRGIKADHATAFFDKVFYQELYKACN